MYPNLFFPFCNICYKIDVVSSSFIIEYIHVCHPQIYSQTILDLTQKGSFKYTIWGWRSYSFTLECTFTPITYIKEFYCSVTWSHSGIRLHLTTGIPLGFPFNRVSPLNLSPYVSFLRSTSNSLHFPLRRYSIPYGF